MKNLNLYKKIKNKKLINLLKEWVRLFKNKKMQIINQLKKLIMIKIFRIIFKIINNKKHN